MALTLTAYFISSWLRLKASGISPVSTSKAETGVEQKAPHAIRNALCSVAYLGFCQGGQSQRREVRGAGGANGVECGEGCPFPTEEGVWGGGCAPSPEIF